MMTADWRNRAAGCNTAPDPQSNAFDNDGMLVRSTVKYGRHTPFNVAR